MCLAALREVGSALPANVFRVKGIVCTVELPETPVVLQVVGRGVDRSSLESWGDQPRTSCVVAIGDADASGEVLNATFERCHESAEQAK